MGAIAPALMKAIVNTNNNCCFPMPSKDLYRAMDNLERDRMADEKVSHNPTKP
ncbi:hypothetical protein [Merismopedia glauca]|uniref:hypothetical protein n=1 Tax=Merismopedia glauca TaxID=292586 RepID=UPI0015E78F1A|nr:hypothetical protein [Merismopedia glauca]